MLDFLLSCYLLIRLPAAFDWQKQSFIEIEMQINRNRIQ